MDNVSILDQNSRLDYRYTGIIGYDQNTAGRDDYRQLWNWGHLINMQQAITELLRGVGPDNRPIVVDLKVIASVLTNIAQNYQPRTGDIYSRYILPAIESERNDVRDLTDMAINVIVSQLRTEYEMANANKNLTIWTTVLGDFNAHGLRAHAPIKVRKRRPNPMQFNMNY